MFQFEAIFQHLLEKFEINHGTCWSGETVSVPRFEPRKSRNLSNTLFTTIQVSDTLKSV
jgi:hypothetical protein